MEVYYRDYSALEQQHLFHLAMYYQLLPSCGSDYHGFYSQETLISYPYSIYEAILNRYQKLYGVSPL